MSAERIARIFDSGFRAVLVTTGGGSGALHSLLSTPGASRFITEAHVPYSSEALERFLGEKPKQAVSPATARALANEGQASSLSAVAVSCTASLQTDRARRGDDRAFICIKTEASEKLYALYFSESSRAEQEALLSGWVLTLIAQAVGAERGLMLPGSFNPVHKGHFGMLKAAEEMTGLRGVFELSCANFDKPDISEEEILRRVSAIRDIPIALTHAPRFAQKAELFPQTTFILGHDTAERLVKNHTLQGMVSDVSTDWKNQWETFQTLEISFLVAGRLFQPLEKKKGGGSAESPTLRASFQCLENLELPKGFEALFEAIPQEIFREDISSTELRKK